MPKWVTYFPVSPGEVVVDLGAGLGEPMLMFARGVGKDGVVIALEPDITNFKVMHRLIIQHQLTNTFAFLAGIGRVTGRAYLNLAGWNEHSTTLSGNRFRGRRVVPIISWDDLVDALAITHVDLAKVNTEGAEIACLEGMTKVFPDKIMLEDHHRFGTDSEHLERLLREKGYTILERRDAQAPICVNNLLYASIAS